MSEPDGWTVGEDMDYARSLLATRQAAGQRYGRWLNARVSGLVDEVDRLRAEIEAARNGREDAAETEHRYLAARMAVNGEWGALRRALDLWDVRPVT